MQPIDTLSVFFIASVLLALTPGPDNLFVLAQAVQRGRVAGLVVTFGLCTGILAQTGAVALGLAALFQTSALLFSLVKYAGAAYLLYLAWQSFRAGEAEENEKVKPLSVSALYRRGIIMNITNPKVSLFFLAFLPQFTDPGYGPLVPQFFILGLVFIASTLFVFGGISLLGGVINSRLGKSAGIQLMLNRMAGLIFIGLAVKLALIKR